MKTNLNTLSFLITLLLTISFQQSYSQTFVNNNATGMNDGSSWENAYVDLSFALETTTSGEVWVAQGTYLPSGLLNGSLAFIINSGIDVYGGFNGTESTFEERDIEANPTILSGDIANNDIENNFVENRVDNVRHVVFVDSLITTPVLIDGFSIVSGHTGDDPDQDEIDWRGGGIFAYSTINISNCNFSQNFARGGAGVFISPNAGGGNNSSFSKCTFSENNSSSQSAGIFLESLSNIRISDCMFSDNETTRGALYPLRCTNVQIENSNFINNETISATGFGGAVFSWNNLGLTFDTCTFMENVGGNGGVMYIDGREIEDVDLVSASFENCVFEDNRAGDFGGGCIYSFSASYDINASVFTGNIANNGSSNFNTGDNTRINYNGTDFTGGSGTFGGAFTCYGENTIYNIDSCTFTENSVATSGGALIIGFGAVANLSNVSFDLNRASFGGAISVQSDLTDINATDCTFTENIAMSNGGGIRISNSGTHNITRCSFLENEADFGGGLFVAETIDSLGTLRLTLNDSRFMGNRAITQAGGINLLNVNGTIENLLATNNFNLMGVAGGALSLNVAGDNVSRTLNISNATIANNFAPIGGGIATFTDSLNSEMIVNIQNSILFNPGSSDYEVEAGTPTINSMGGNLSSDLTTEDIFINVEDQRNIDDMFFVDSQSDYHLTAESPAVNAGVSNGAPSLDLEGNSRIGDVDAGAFEFQGSSSTNNPDFNKNLILKVFPNPVGDYLNLSFENEWKGQVKIRVFSVDGKEILKWTRDKKEAIYTERLNISDLGNNGYELTIDNGKEILARRFVKIKR